MNIIYLSYYYITTYHRVSLIQCISYNNERVKLKIIINTFCSSLLYHHFIVLLLLSSVLSCHYFIYLNYSYHFHHLLTSKLPLSLTLWSSCYYIIFVIVWNSHSHITIWRWRWRWSVFCECSRYEKMEKDWFVQMECENGKHDTGGALNRRSHYSSTFYKIKIKFSRKNQLQLTTLSFKTYYLFSFIINLFHLLSFSIL